MKKKLFLLLNIFFVTTSYAQLQNDDVWKTDLGKSAIRNIIRIPDIEGYKTLKCDFHVHTVFSDGKVWPDVRVDEAWQQGYDAIAITDHIEYRPHKDQVIGDLNESYKIAKKRADQIGFILIKGTEITRSKPLGHLNALFLTDANPLDVEDPLEAINIARKQGAVILWNHPGWPDDKSTVYDVHEKLIAEKKIDMVEVHNHMEYYPLTFDWMEKYGLAPSANSDTHDVIANEYGMEKMGRPITLVFAKEHSENAIKEALMAGRTAALFNDCIVAKKEWAEKIVWSSVQYRIISTDATSAVVEIENLSDIPFVIYKSPTEKVVLPAGKTIRTGFTVPGTIKIGNVYIGHNKNLELTLPSK
ncbi:MAG: PHP domain-containing protein [Tannerella sp.]|jgi:predicted metal-dependent phosphoesterase TrpH|nr:PHP domain-containing protein [Tannerella sp.]